MAKSQQLEDLVQQLFRLLPENVEHSRQDIEKNIRAALSSSLARMNLVSREEFDIQSELLSKTRMALDELEARIAEMEREEKAEKE